MLCAHVYCVHIHLRTRRHPLVQVPTKYNTNNEKKKERERFRKWSWQQRFGQRRLVPTNRQPDTENRLGRFYYSQGCLNFAPPECMCENNIVAACSCSLEGDFYCVQIHVCAWPLSLRLGPSMSQEQRCVRMCAISV